MADGKKSFLLYCDIQSTVKKLSDEQAGKLFKIILSYVNDEYPVVDDVLLDIVFEPIKMQLKRDLKRYESIVEKRILAGQASAEKRKLHEQVSTCVESVEHVSTVIENVTVTDSVSVTDKEKKETPSPLKGEATDLNKIDFKMLGDYYNTKLCPPLQKIILPISKGRQAVVLARAKEHGKQRVVDMLKAVNESSFLLGENDKCWKANFDWLFKPTNFLKVLEGNYANTEANGVLIKKASAEQTAIKTSLDRQKQNEEHFKKLDENAKNAVLPPKDLSILKHIK